MSKTVKFRGGSPSGQSYLGHQPSDSGVGSFSDSESRAAYPDHAYTGSDYDSPNVYALQDALASEANAKERWMKKATELDSLLLRAHKELKETEARLRALEDHVEELEDDKTKLTKTNKDLVEENARLKEDLKDVKKSPSSSSSSSSSRRKSSSPPLMSGAIAAEEEKKDKPKRSASKKHSIKESERAEREKERERIHREIEKEMEREHSREKDREMDRLRRRFNKDGGEESDAKSSNTSNKSHRNRRDSYVEPLGQSAPRPQVVPPSPSRQYSYSSNPYPPQTYQSGNVPRVVHPSVVVSYGDTFHEDRDEDGMYHPHPLPKQQRAPDRRERR